MQILKNTWRHMRRSPYQAFAAISIMLLTFVLSGFFILSSWGTYSLLKHFEQAPQVIAFFNDVKSEEEILTLAQRFNKMEEVADVKYVSKDEALQIYQEQYKDEPLLLEMVTADILPASLEVSTIKIEYLSDIAQILEKEIDVQEVVYQRDVADKLSSWFGAIRSAGLILIPFLFIISTLTIFTVVGMKVALRKSEIEILQLIGASRWYIKVPFLIEGMIYGLLGSFLGIGVNVGLFIAINPNLVNMIGSNSKELLYSSFIPNIFVLYSENITAYIGFTLIMVFLGMLMGFISSLLALLRYLR